MLTLNNLIKIQDLKQLGFKKIHSTDTEFYYSLDINTDLEDPKQITLITGSITEHITATEVYTWENAYDEIAISQKEISELILLQGTIAKASMRIEEIINKTE